MMLKDLPHSPAESDAIDGERRMVVPVDSHASKCPAHRGRYDAASVAPRDKTDLLVAVALIVAVIGLTCVVIIALLEFNNILFH